MLKGKEKKYEEEKYPSLNSLRPQGGGFQPYHLVKHELKEKSQSKDSGPFPSSNTSSAGESKKTRRRRRLSCEKDLSPESFRKTRNKRLAKESRMRKVGYIQSLEQKVSELENKIIALNERLESYRKKISHLEIDDKRGHENLSTAQDYWHTQVSETLKKKSTSESHLKDIVDYFIATLGIAGSDRKKVIKNAIRVIIDNIVPESVKVLLYANKHKLLA